MSSTPDLSEADRIEQAALRSSAFGYLFMAALGIGFALFTRSEAILLDGTYSLISFGAALLATGVARLVSKPGSNSFHFGYAHFEPLLNTVRGFLILGVAIFALVSAIDALLHGGRSITAGVAVVYGAVAAAGCLFMAWNQRRQSRRAGSPLLQVDSRNWFVDGLLSVGAFIAFVTAYVLQASGAMHLAPYVDPALVTIMVAAMVRVPLITIWENLREVLQVAPEWDDQEAVRRCVVDAVADLPSRDVQVRMAKIGRHFYVLTRVVLPADWKPESVEALDAVRGRIARALDDVPLRLVTDTVFTAERCWGVPLDHEASRPPDDGQQP